MDDFKIIRMPSYRQTFYYSKANFPLVFDMPQDDIENAAFEIIKVDLHRLQGTNVWLGMNEQERFIVYSIHDIEKRG